MTIKFPSIRFSLACLALAFFGDGCVSQGVTSRVAFPKVAINGHPARMLLDTGAASTVLYDSAAAKLGLQFTPPLARDSGGGPFEIVTGMAVPAQVTSGAQSFTTRLPVFALPGFSTPEEDGVIGWPEVRNDILVFDGSIRQVRSAAQIPADASGWLTLKVRPHDTLLLETPLDDGKIGIILVDTGAPLGIQLAPALWNKIRAAQPQTPTTIVNHSTWPGGAFPGEAMVADEVSLGALKLTNVTVETMAAAENDWITRACPDAEVAGVIGLNGLVRIDLVVDGENGVAYIHPTGRREDAGDWSVAENVRLNCDNLLVRAGIDECTGGNFDAAVADYTAALAINPKNAAAYANRALALIEKGEAITATADDTKALEFDPRNPAIYTGRALARQIQGDFAGALADYEKVIELNPDDSANVRLYRETLRRRLGRAPDDFSDTVAGWKNGWPKTIGLFVAGRMAEMDFVAAAETRDNVPSLNRDCEAFYFIGMNRLLNGDAGGARSFFQKSIATGVRTYTEYQFAAAELSRLNAAAPR